MRAPISLYELSLQEGAGASPSQRTGTRLGGVVSSRDCRVDSDKNDHNTVKPVGKPRSSVREILEFEKSRERYLPVYCQIRMGHSNEKR
jgi:hypothetical protein